MKIPRVNAIIAISVAGFILAVLLIAANEILDIPSRVFNAPPTLINWTEISIEAIFVLIVGSLTVFIIRRLDLRRKQAKEALAAAHAFQQSIIDGVADSIMVIDLDYRVKLMNRAAREFSSGLIDTSKPFFCYQVHWQRDKPCGGRRYPCPLEKVRESGRPVTVLHEHYRVNEERQFLEVIAAPFLGTDGTFQGIIESVRDCCQSAKWDTF